MNSEPETGPPRQRTAPLDMTPERFREIGHDLVDRIADRMATLASQKVLPGESPDEIRSALQAESGLPGAGGDAAAAVAAAAELLFAHSAFNGHPRFFGYVTSSPAPIGAFGDLLAAAINANVGAWKLAPMASEIEAQTVRWISEFIGFPPDCGGLLVSGGNMANFVGFLAARAAKAGWDVRAEGMAGAGSRKLLFYCSTEAHTWVQKAADLFGLGTGAIRWVPVDSRRRMRLDDLRRQVDADASEGARPFLVAGTAGSVSTGAVDPLGEIAAFCRERDLWFHVDGAYGGFAARVPGAPSELRGLSEADSVAVDPHKWLYAPLEAGCALVRDPARLAGAFSYHPPYYNFDTEAVNYFDLGPQNSRGFRALKVWLGLRQAGRAGYEKMIADDCALAGCLYRLLGGHPEFEALTHNLSITTFRYVPRNLRPGIGSAPVEEKLNRLNQDLLNRIERDGAAFLSNAIIDGRYALRACIVNFRTSLGDIEALPELVARLGREASAAIK